MNLKLKLYKLLCLICVFTLFCTICEGMVVVADDIHGKAASVYAYALNNEIAQYGVMSSSEAYEPLASYMTEKDAPNGVLYSDVIDFEKNDFPYLVIFRADSGNRAICADVYGYDEEKKTAVPVVTLVKGCNADEHVTGEFSVGYYNDERYIIYNEYYGETLVTSEYYTILNKTALRYVCQPEYAQQQKIVLFGGYVIYPETDISDYNEQLDEFFSKLKNASADSVTYKDISEDVAVEEEDRLEKVLTKAAKFGYIDIDSFDSLNDYLNRMENPDTDNKFYSITNLYDIGDEMYYVRFATDDSFYNYAVLRKTDQETDGYQILAVRTDSIPLSDVELAAVKESYTHNRFVSKKAKKPIKLTSDLVTVKKINIEKIIDVPKLINDELRIPFALIGGGICLALLALLWITLVSDE